MLTVIHSNYLWFQCSGTNTFQMLFQILEVHSSRIKKYFWLIFSSIFSKSVSTFNEMSQYKKCRILYGFLIQVSSTHFLKTYTHFFYRFKFSSKLMHYFFLIFSTLLFLQNILLYTLAILKLSSPGSHLME